MSDLQENLDMGKEDQDGGFTPLRQLGNLTGNKTIQNLNNTVNDLTEGKNPLGPSGIFNAAKNLTKQGLNQTDLGSTIVDTVSNPLYSASVATNAAIEGALKAKEKLSAAKNAAKEKLGKLGDAASKQFDKIPGSDKAKAAFSKLKGFASSKSTMDNPSNNPKNMPFMSGEGKDATPPQSVKIEPLSKEKMFEKIVKDPFFLYNSTKKLIDISVHPDLKNQEDVMEPFFFKGIEVIFYRNYFKIFMTVVFLFQLIFYGVAFKDNQLKYIMIPISAACVAAIILFVNEKYRVAVTGISLGLLVFVFPIWFAVYKH
jgi:hypothetical protein